MASGGVVTANRSHGMVFGEMQEGESARRLVEDICREYLVRFKGVEDGRVMVGPEI